MIDELYLRNFKCFAELRLPLQRLTMLTGTNASGKSSVLQSLVLLHQTMREHEWSGRLFLNGSSICLGTVADVVDKVHGRDTVEIGICVGDVHYMWKFKGDRADMSMDIERITIGGKTYTKPAVFRHLLIPEEDGGISKLAKQLRFLSYITAERIGPRDVYTLEDREIATEVGPTGELAASLLYWGRDENVDSELLISGIPNTRLRQVEAVMNSFFPGCTLEVLPIPQANAVTLGVRTSDDTGFHRPIHVGFGLTQVLPIIIAAISASKDDILLIENPEVHLHPAGQAQMGLFLSKVAAAGIQVILETHSDHILNGIRRAVKTGIVNHNSVGINFFYPRSSNTPQVISPQIDEFGNIDTWPSGFFDQFDIDTNFFAGWSE